MTNRLDLNGVFKIHLRNHMSLSSCLVSLIYIYKSQVLILLKSNAKMYQTLLNLMLADTSVNITNITLFYSCFSLPGLNQGPLIGNQHISQLSGTHLNFNLPNLSSCQISLQMSRCLVWMLGASGKMLKGKVILNVVPFDKPRVTT